MLCLAGPIGLKFLRTLMGGRGVLQAIKNLKFFFHGQMAGPIGLTFFVDTHEWPGGVIGLKNRKYFLIFISIFPRATPGP